jgi:hypothetical protein
MSKLILMPVLMILSLNLSKVVKKRDKKEIARVICTKEHSGKCKAIHSTITCHFFYPLLTDMELREEAFASDCCAICNSNRTFPPIHLLHTTAVDILYIFFILYYDQQMHNYFTNYRTPTRFDTIVSSSGSF